MKNLRFLILFLLLFDTGFGQYFRITNDTTLLLNSELVLRNSTKNKEGSFIKNKGNGITEFAYAVDSIRTGHDTIFFHRGDGWSSIKMAAGASYTDAQARAANAGLYPSLSVGYVNPSWITSLPASKITGLQAGVGANSGTVAELRAMATTTGNTYFSTDRGGGTWVDEGLNDGGAVDDNATIIITANGHRLRKQLTQGTVNASSFGVVGDGTTDNTTALQTAINFAQSIGWELLIDVRGKIRFTDQLAITRALKIRGSGVVTSDTTNSASTLLFDNGQVDVSGNATKSAFIVNEPVLYQLYNLSFENLSIIHRRQTPKNQHTVLINGSNVTFWNLKDVTVYNATGSIIYLKDGGAQYTPYAQQINWKNIKGYNVGGFLSQNGSNTWFVGGTVDNVSLEVAINPVSPQPVLADFTGFRGTTFSNLIFEGSGNVNTSTVVKTTTGNNLINGLWVEYPTNPPGLMLDARESIKIIGVAGLTKTTKIRAMGRNTVVDVQQAGTADPSDQVIINENGGKVNLAQNYSFFTSSGFGAGDSTRPFVKPNRIGRTKLQDVTSYDGGTYSQDNKIELFSLAKGYPLRVPQTLNSFVTTSAFGPSPTITSVLDTAEGRVLKFTPSSGFANEILFNIKIPAKYIGSAVTIGFRYKVEAANNTGDYYAFYHYGEGAIANTSNGTSDPFPATNSTHINLLNRRNSWENGYISIGETSGDIIIHLGRDRSLTTAHIVYLSDLKVVIGNQLPDLKPAGTDPVTDLADVQPPTVGYFIKGDFIRNLNPASGLNSVTGWQRLTTGTGNIIGTDWLETGIPDTVSVRTFNARDVIRGGQTGVGTPLKIFSNEVNSGIAEGVVIGAEIGKERTGGNLVTFKNGNTVFGGISGADGSLSTPHVLALQDIKIKNQYVVSEGFNPEGNVAAPVGSLAINSVGGTLAIKKTGTGVTGWEHLTSSSILTDSLDARYAASAFILRNAGGTGDTIMNASKEANTAIYKRISVTGSGVTRTVTDSTINYSISGGGGSNGSLSFTADGSTKDFTFVTTGIPAYTSDKRVFLTVTSATGTSIDWVEKSSESFTVHFVTAPTTGNKNIDFFITP